MHICQACDEKKFLDESGFRTKLHGSKRMRIYMRTQGYVRSQETDFLYNHDRHYFHF